MSDTGVFKFLEIWETLYNLTWSAFPLIMTVHNMKLYVLLLKGWCVLKFWPHYQKKHVQQRAVGSAWLYPYSRKPWSVDGTWPETHTPPSSSCSSSSSHQTASECCSLVIHCRAQRCNTQSMRLFLFTGTLQLVATVCRGIAILSEACRNWVY